MPTFMTWHKCKLIWDDVQGAFLPRSLQGQGDSLKLITRVVSVLYILKSSWALQKTLHKC